MLCQGEEWCYFGKSVFLAVTSDERTWMQILKRLTNQSNSHPKNNTYNIGIFHEDLKTNNKLTNEVSIAIKVVYSFIVMVHL